MGEATEVEVCNVDDGDCHVEVEVAEAGVAFDAVKERNWGVSVLFRR